MKKLLKILFWATVAAFTSFTFIACEKPENEPLQPETTETLQWWLKVNVPAMTYSSEMPAKAIGTNIGADGQKVGASFDFEDSRFKARVFTETNRWITQFTGSIDGKAFIVHENVINVCNGVQGEMILYTLKLKCK